MAIKTIDSPYFAGDDALRSQFDIVISNIPGIAADGSLSVTNAAGKIIDFNVQEGLQMRAMSITIPDTELATYEASYKSLKMTKLGGQITTPNEFSFNFRVDKNWMIYSALDKWMATIADPITGIIDTAQRIKSIIVKVIDLKGDSTFPGWEFQGCLISKLGGVSFEQGSGDPVEAEATFQFIRKIPLDLIGASSRTGVSIRTTYNPA